MLDVHQYTHSNSSLAFLQVPLANRYGYVTLYDDTMVMKNARLPLGVFAVVVNEFNTPIVCVALLSDTTTSTFKWLLKKYTEAHQGAPTVFLVDADSAMKGAASEVRPDIQQRRCDWHLHQNLRKNPSSTLGNGMSVRLRHSDRSTAGGWGGVGRGLGGAGGCDDYQMDSHRVVYPNISHVMGHPPMFCPVHVSAPSRLPCRYLNLRQGFVNMFRIAQNQLTQEKFEQRFNTIVKEYPVSEKYLMAPGGVYEDRARWTEYLHPLRFDLLSRVTSRVEGKRRSGMCTPLHCVGDV